MVNNRRQRIAEAEAVRQVNVHACFAERVAEIVVAVIIENVDSGTATATVAADIYDYYFSTKNQISDFQSPNELLR